MASLRLKEAAMDPHKRTTNPIVTGTSVLAVKYRDGVLMLADTLGSYGTLAMYKNIRRIFKVNDNTMIGCSGEVSDMQFIQGLLDELTVNDFCLDDGKTLSPKEIHSYLSRVMYNRRSRINPLYNQIAVAGVKNGKSFLGYVDLYGSNFEEDIVTTGYGSYYALPLLRKAWRPDLSEAEAKAVLEDSMRVLYYRDVKTINRFTLARVNADGINISEPYELTTEWTHALFINPDSQQ